MVVLFFSEFVRIQFLLTNMSWLWVLNVKTERQLLHCFVVFVCGVCYTFTDRSVV